MSVVLTQACPVDKTLAGPGHQLGKLTHCSCSWCACVSWPDSRLDRVRGTQGHSQMPPWAMGREDKQRASEEENTKLPFAPVGLGIWDIPAGELRTWWMQECGARFLYDQVMHGSGVQCGNCSLWPLPPGWGIWQDSVCGGGRALWLGAKLEASAALPKQRRLYTAGP